MIARVDKSRLTDVVNTKNLLRFVQSIPSKKAEPFKMWLAQVGSERFDEIAGLEKAISSINASNKNLLEIKPDEDK